MRTMAHALRVALPASPVGGRVSHLTVNLATFCLTYGARCRTARRASVTRDRLRVAEHDFERQRAADRVRGAGIAHRRQHDRCPRRPSPRSTTCRGTRTRAACRRRPAPCGAARRWAAPALRRSPAPLSAECRRRCGVAGGGVGRDVGVAPRCARRAHARSANAALAVLGAAGARTRRRRRWRRSRPARAESPSARCSAWPRRSAGSSPITRVVGESDGRSSDGAAAASGSAASSASASRLQRGARSCA